MIAQNISVDNNSIADNIPTITVEVGINRDMKAIKKSEAKSYLNGGEHWENAKLTLTELAAYIENGGTWRPGLTADGAKGSTDKDMVRFHLTALDIDKDGVKLSDWLSRRACLLYKTLSNSEKEPWKVRWVFRFNRPVLPAEYRTVYLALVAECEGKVDTSCQNEARYFFGSNQPVTLCDDSVTLDVDELLARHASDAASVPQTKEPAKRNARVERAERMTRVRDSREQAKKQGTENSSVIDAVHMACLKVSTSRSEQPGNVSSVLKALQRLYSDKCLSGGLQLKHRPNISANPADRQPTYQFEGRSPASQTNSSGKTLLISVYLEFDEFGEAARFQTLWFSRDNGHVSSFNESSGGTVLEFWGAYHPKMQTGTMTTETKFLDAFTEENPSLIIYGLPHSETKLRMLVRARSNQLLQLDVAKNCVLFKGKRLDYNDEMLKLYTQLTDMTPRVKEQAFMIVLQVAKEQPIDTFLEEVKSFAAHYGPNPNLVKNLAFLTGHTPQNTSEERLELYNQMLYLHMIAAIARSVYPGTKFDNIVVFQGKKGNGKTELWKLLYSYCFKQSYVTDTTCTLDNAKDMYLNMLKFKLILHDEMVRGPKWESNRWKSILVQTHISMRAPYGADTQEYALRCLHGGASNEDDFVNDPTGDRRHWPIETIHTFAMYWKDDEKDIQSSVRKDKARECWAAVYHDFVRLDALMKVTGETWDEYLRLPAHLWGVAEKASAKFNASRSNSDEMAEKINALCSPEPNFSRRFPGLTKGQKQPKIGDWLTVNEVNMIAGWNGDVDQPFGSKTVTPQEKKDARHALKALGWEPDKTVKAKEYTGKAWRYMGNKDAADEKAAADIGRSLTPAELLAWINDVAPTVMAVPTEKSQPAPAPSVEPAQPAPQVKPEQPAQPEMEQPSAEWVDEAAILKQFVPADEPAQPAPSVEPAPQVEPAQPEWVDEEYIPGQHKPVQPTQEESKKAEEELAELSKLLYGD